MMFPTEPSILADILTQRKESARKTLPEASPEELRSLVHELFPDGTHPWAAPLSNPNRYERKRSGWALLGSSMADGGGTLRSARLSAGTSVAMEPRTPRGVLIEPVL